MDSGLCGKTAPPTAPPARTCKGQEGIPTLEDVRKNHNGCPLHMVCPAMFSPLNFTRCMVKYNCPTGGLLLKPVHGPHGSVHGGRMMVISNQTLSDLDRDFEENSDSVKKDGDDVEDNANETSEADNDGGDAAEATDGGMCNEDVGDREASPVIELASEVGDWIEEELDISDRQNGNMDLEEEAETGNGQESGVVEGFETEAENLTEEVVDTVPPATAEVLED